ncbi:MAG: M23 family metallopeptidase [Hyphomicrobiaceae bacterium]|nr:M23 family metallopeptidase [Hyphomicrobiaceae bacterium]MCC0024565.1 M23 family metallopeptidase [Hyphomicrobiaceae bacterium]
MSNRLRVSGAHVVPKVTATLLVAVSLAGCSGLGFGGTSAQAPLFTGSTQTANPGDLNQAMPNQLSRTGEPDGRYLPPADVGSQGMSDPMMTGSIAPIQPISVMNGPTQSVATQPLPTLPQTQTPGNQPAMQAHQNVTPLFQNNSTPTVDPVTTPQRNLSVVPDNAFQHTIERGESLYAIARRYGVTTEQIIDANNLDAPDQIYVGQKLIIPGRPDLLAARAPQSTPAQQPTDNTTTGAITPQATVRTVQTVPVTPAATPQAEPAPVQQVANTTPAAPSQTFRWPVQGRVIVDFDASRQTGINIEAPEGAAVRAAESGTVIYVGNGIEGYGNLVLVRHANGYVSAYAHLKSINVAKDDVISRGDTLGSVGMSGSVNRPQLHFELRQGATPIDPMPLLAS